MGRTKVDFPWERLTGEPLIYASMGTVLNVNLDVFQTIVTVLTKHDDVQLVLSVGGQIDPQRIVSPPKNAIIVPRAPQLDLLKLASVCVTHAGLNTVLESLAQGVPQVAIPVTFDQPGVAARIAHRQTGVVTSLDKLTPDHLSELLDEVLINSTYRANAKKLQRKIVEANGLAVAADVVEEALGVRETPRGFSAARNNSWGAHLCPHQQTDRNICECVTQLWQKQIRIKPMSNEKTNLALVEEPYNADTNGPTIFQSREDRARIEMEKSSSRPDSVRPDSLVTHDLDRALVEAAEEIDIDWPESLPVERIKAGIMEIALGFLLCAGLAAFCAFYRFGIDLTRGLH
jgi:hypothetical protein